MKALLLGKNGQVGWELQRSLVPLNQSGASKLAGEQAIQASGCQHLIFRTSWVCAARGNNFAKTMLCLAAEQESRNVIADQFGAPTGADLRTLGAIATSAYPTPAQRPANSRLNTEKLQKAFTLRLPHWQSGAARMLTEILEKTQ